MKSLLLIISFAAWSVTFAQPAYFQWSRYTYESSPGNSLQSVEKLTVDTAGNVYFVGEVYPTVAVRARLTRKYSPSGNLIWSQVYNGGGGSETARDICVDKRGNTYVTGWSKVPNMSGAYDLIVIKYDSVGAERWVYRYSGTHQNRSNTGVRLALDANQNNVYVGGWVTNAGDNVDMVVIKVIFPPKSGHEVRL
jgi:hypothetical protein